MALIGETAGQRDLRQRVRRYHQHILGSVQAVIDADPATLIKLILLARSIAAAMCTAWRPDGVVVAQLNGPAAGQTVEHLHFHIIPRRAEQGLQGDWADPDRLSGLARELAAALPC